MFHYILGYTIISGHHKITLLYILLRKSNMLLNLFYLFAFELSYHYKIDPVKFTMNRTK